MNTSTITDIAWEGAQLAFRLIMAARSRRDAEAVLLSLRALGETPRSDVEGIEAGALARLAGALPKASRDLDAQIDAEIRRLRQDEPTQSSPLEKRRHAPDFPPPAMSTLADEWDGALAGLARGPLGEGD